MRGHELADSAEQTRARRSYIRSEHFRQRFIIERGRNREMLEQRFDFGCERG
jgi:hypothetical protein